MSKNNSYKYPDWIESVREISHVSRSEKNPLVVSVAETERHHQILDIRLFRDGLPTHTGVFVGYESALNLVEILKDYLTDEYSIDHR